MLIRWSLNNFVQKRDLRNFRESKLFVYNVMSLSSSNDRETKINPKCLKHDCRDISDFTQKYTLLQRYALMYEIWTTKTFTYKRRSEIWFSKQCFSRTSLYKYYLTQLAMFRHPEKRSHLIRFRLNQHRINAIIILKLPW